MTRAMWVKRAVAASVLAVGLPLAGCSEASQALEGASGALDKAAACSEALGIVTGFNPESLAPEQLQQQAGEKASQLRDLGNKVADASVQDALFAVADGYVELEQRQAEGVAKVNEWAQRNLGKINKLKQVCL